jgi:hypothetical protein
MFWVRISLLMVFVASSYFLVAQSPKKAIEYRLTNGLQMTGIDDSNPVIYDNDLVIDTPEVFYLWLKANKGQVKLVGNINTRDMYNQPDYEFQHDDTFSQWTDLYDRALRSNLKNIPAPVKGADVALVKPKSGIIEDTKYKSNAGSDLIIAEAHKASPEKPLCIFVGGNVSTIAHAYLKDHTIANKILVFHVHGYKHNEHTYNTYDFWGAYVVMKRMKYINWSGDKYSWYHKVRPLKVDLTGMPNNPFTELIRYWYGAAYAEHGDMGDGPPILYFFDHSLWKGVIRLREDGMEGSQNLYDYLLVSDNDWSGYGRNLSDYLRNPDNYISQDTDSDKK